MKSAIEDKIRDTTGRIRRVAGDRNVKLIAASKTVSAETVKRAYEAGVLVFGENRIQEGIPKIMALSDLPIEWHFIGHLQTNKAKEAVRYFSWIQSVDSLRLLLEIEKQASRQSKKMDLLLEMNLGVEESKHGFSDTDVREALQASGSLQSCRIRGFMAIPPYFEDAEKVRPFFRRLAEMRASFAMEHPDLTELSMGMSHDFEVAVEEGATMVRIGTALFGARG